MRNSTDLSPLKPTPMRDIIWLFVGTRLMLIVGGFISFILFPIPQHVYPNTPVNLAAVLQSWNQWDSTYYVRIAQFGYQSLNEAAFFPLFSLLTKGVALLFGNQAYWLAALIVSNLALFGALYMLYQLATDALGERVGWRTIVYLCLFPTAFFFFAGYNESLFLFLSCSTLFALRRQRWLLAGAFGLLAALTRSAGLLLVLPYLYELWNARDQSQADLGSLLKNSFLKALPLLLIPLGTLLYSLYCWRHFHDPLAFATVQKYWGRAFSWPWMGLYDAFKQLFFIQGFGTFSEIHIFIDLTATLGFIALAILGWKRLRPSYTLWAGLLLLYILCSSATSVMNSPDADILMSNQRFVLEMFPCFITLAALGLKYHRLHQGILLCFPFLQALMMALFVLSRWMV
ncbi:MAG TPA: mannosyltransferase family protein [Ktedonobacteraceae bacterium]